MSYSDRIVDLIGERFDAAVRIGALKDSSLVARKIAPVRAVMVASPEYLARNGWPSTPDDLANHEHLVYTGAFKPDWVFRVGKRAISIRPQGRVRSDSGDAILQWAIEGLGIGLLPTFLVSDALESGRLEPILLDYATAGVMVIYCCAAARRLCAGHGAGLGRHARRAVWRRTGLGPLPDARKASQRFCCIGWP